VSFASFECLLVCGCIISYIYTEEDYEKVFRKPPPKKKNSVYEVGDGGVDISP